MCNRRLVLLPLIALLAAGLCSCRQEAPGGRAAESEQVGSESEPEQAEPTEPETEEPEESLEVYTPDDAQGFVLYLYDHDINPDFALPIPMPVEASLDVQALMQMISVNSPQYGSFTELEHLQITGDTAVLTFQQKPGVDRLMTLWATLRENSTEVQQVQFLLDGVPLQNEYTDRDGYCTLTEVALAPLTSEELTALRRQVPLEPLSEEYEFDLLPVYADAKSSAMTGFLATMFAMNSYPEHGFDTPAQAPARFVLQTAVNWMPRSNNRQAHAELYEQLDQYNQYWNTYYLQEHLAETAYILFGEEAPIEHQTLGMWNYNPYTGFYTPAFLDYYSTNIPVIVERRNAGNLWELEVVFVTMGPDGEIYGLFNERVERENLAEYCTTIMPRHTITLREKEEGGYLYQGHILPDKPYRETFFATRLPEGTLTLQDLGCVIYYAEGALGAELSRIGSARELVLDEGGDKLLIVCAFYDSVVMIERLEWSDGVPTPVETVYTHSPQLGDNSDLGMLELRVDLSSAQYRLTLGYQGDSAQILLDGRDQAPGIVQLVDAPKDI